MAGLLFGVVHRNGEYHVEQWPFSGECVIEGLSRMDALSVAGELNIIGIGRELLTH